MTGDGPTLDTLPALCRHAAATWPDRIGLVFDETGAALTFAEIDARSDRIAAGLAARGVGPGDRVAVMLPNCPDFPLSWLGIAKAGAVMVAVNVFYKTADAGYLLSHSGARLVITSDAFVGLLAAVADASDAPLDILSVADLTAAAPAAPPAVAVGPETLANIQYTSGTTGQPKGVMQSHGMWGDFARRMANLHDGLSRDDIILTAQPFYYMDPQWNLATVLLTGARLIVLDRFHPSTFWDRVRTHRVTWFYCLGVMPKLLLKQPPAANDRDHAVRRVLCSAIPAADHAAIEARWGVPWFETFGMTETGVDLVVPLDEHDISVGSGCIGRPLPTREACILGPDGARRPPGEVGELALRGPGMMDGYYRDPAATAAAFRDGWLHTGDLARIDDNGRIFFIGRDKDMIRRSGENIAAAEVEAVIAQHDAVRLAACVAVADDIRGEEVKAYVVLQPGPGSADTTPADLAAFCAERLAYFKVPRYWTFRGDLPRTPSERVIKGALESAPDGAATATWDRTEDTWR